MLFDDDFGYGGFLVGLFFFRCGKGKWDVVDFEVIGFWVNWYEVDVCGIDFVVFDGVKVEVLYVKFDVVYVDDLKVGVFE